MTELPRIGTRIAQRYDSRDETWTVYGKVDNRLYGPDPCPTIVLLNDQDGVSQWTVKGMTADKFWQHWTPVNEGKGRNAPERASAGPNGQADATRRCPQ